MPRIGIVGAVVTAMFLLLALAGEAWAPYPPGLTHYDRILEEPSGAHWMGTDHLGRDLFSRLVAGAQTTLGLAFAVAAANAGIALFIGSLCGFLGGRFDAVVMRVADAVLALPGFLLAICFLGIFGGGVFQMWLFLVLTGWAQLARIVRNEISIVRSLDYITANTAAGYSLARNLFLNALPAVLPTLLILLINTLTGAVFAILSLSFLGLGVSPDRPEWGLVLYDARSFILTSPWLFLFPAVFIAAFTLGLHLLADGLREYLDRRKVLLPSGQIGLLAASSTSGSETP